MDEGEVFDLNSIPDYELLSNEDGTVLIQDNCVVIKHKQTAEIKMLPLSDEVLQALGLALVLEDEDVKKPHSPVEIHMEESVEEQPGSVLQEFIMERLDHPQDAGNQSKPDESQEETDEGEESQQEGRGLTSFVFTDDEDADMDKSQDEGSQVQNSPNKLDRVTMTWSGGMVGCLLDLYEELQDRFRRNRNHKMLWHEIYARMCLEFPQLKQWSEQHVQSKFNGLKRTYKGASLYFKENMHTTKWVYFDRMKRIMDKAEAEEGEGPAHNEFRSRSDFNRSGGGSLSWQRRWTLRALEEYWRQLAGPERGAVLWSNVRDKVIEAEPDFEAVTVEQLKRKVFSLKRLFRAHRARPGSKLHGELKDQALYERISKICSKPGLSDEDPEVGWGVGQWTTAGGAGAGAGAGVEQFWARAHTDYLLDLCAAASGGARSEIIEEVSERMQQRFGAVGDFSPARCQQKLSSLRHTFNTIVERKPPGAWKTVTWPFFEKSLKIFHKPLEIWSRANTLLLLELYARVRRYVDEAAPRFWAALADKLKQQKPGLMITPRKCEVKMQAMFARYKATLKKDPEQRADAWPFFNKMDSILGLGSRDVWPPQAQSQMLTLYQQRLHLLEGGAAPQAVYSDVASILSKMFPNLTITGEICQKRLLDLKAKYVNLSQDPRAASAWPLYKRMSDIFATHLWSKANVNHLIDAYEEASGGGGGAGGGGPLWARVAAIFTKKSAAGAAAAHQCRTEFNVLKTRYYQLRNGDPAAAKKWPFYERMDKVLEGSNRKDSPQKSAGGGAGDGGAAGGGDGGAAGGGDGGAAGGGDGGAAGGGDGGAAGGGGGARSRTFLTELGQIKLEVLADLAHADADESQQEAKETSNSQSTEATKLTTEEEQGGAPEGELRGEGGGEESDDSRDSIADRLEELLVGRPAKRMKTDSPERAAAADEQQQETPARVTRSVQHKVEWSESETLQLLEAYSGLRAAGGAGGDTPRTWASVYKKVKSQLEGKKTAGNCAEKMNQLKSKFRALEKGKAAAELGLSEPVLEKLKEIFESTQAKPKENGSTSTPPSAVADYTIDNDTLQKILQELENRSEHQRQRTEYTKKYFEEKEKRDSEKLKVLKKIEESLTKLMKNDEGTHKVLIETLEGCLND